MDFAQELSRVAAVLDALGSRWAVVGGVALAALGMPRTTLDLDLIAEAAVQADLVSWLEQQGFATLHRSAGYSNHLHAQPRRGRIDVVYVTGTTADKLFAGVRYLPGPGGGSIPVPLPEHLAAMKILAMKNDPARTFQELADVRFLWTLPGADRSAIGEQFRRHGLEKKLDEILGTL